MSLGEIGSKRKGRIGFGILALLLLIILDYSVWSILRQVPIVLSGLTGFILSLNAYLIYTVVLSFFSKVVFFPIGRPPKMPKAFSTWSLIQAVMFLLELPSLAIIVYGFFSGTAFYQKTGVLIASSLLITYLVLQYAQYDFAIFESVGETTPERDLANNMIYNLPYLMFCIGLVLFSFVSPLMLDPCVMIGVYITMGVLLHFFYVKIPFMRSKTRWKEEEPARHYRERKELEERDVESLRRSAPEWKLVTKSHLVQIKTQLGLIRNSQLIDEVDKSPDHPYTAIVAFAGATLSVLILLAVEWLLFLF